MWAQGDGGVGGEGDDGLCSEGDDGGLADPWGALIDVCDAVTNTPLASWEDIDEVFAIDPSIWSVVLENLLTDDDSYVNKGADFMIYRNPIDGRTHLLQRDANETFTDPDWSVTYNFNASNKPVLSHVLDVPELRQRYMAHYRDAMIYANWDYFGPIFEAHRDLIDAHVVAERWSQPLCCMSSISTESCYQVYSVYL